MSDTRRTAMLQRAGRRCLPSGVLFGAAIAVAISLPAPALAQLGAPVASADWNAGRTTTDEVFAIKGWKGGTTDGGQQSFTTGFSWSIVALSNGAYHYQYEFLKTRGPRLGTLGIEMPAFCSANLLGCIDPASITASIVQLPSATFSITPSWYDFSLAEADLIPLTMNPFSGLRFDLDNFESGGGPDGTGLASMTWRIGFNSYLAPRWGNFFASPLLSEEEGEGGPGGPGGGNPDHGDEGEVEGPVGCVIDYGVAPDPITGETEIPGPPRAYNCGAFYTGNIENGGWVATPGTVVPEPSTYALMVAGLLGLGVVARRRQR